MKTQNKGIVSIPPRTLRLGPPHVTKVFHWVLIITASLKDKAAVTVSDGKDPISCINATTWNSPNPIGTLGTLGKREETVRIEDSTRGLKII